LLTEAYLSDATGLIGVGRRQIYRLMQAFRSDGADGLISRKRGGPSNRALGLVFRATVLAIVRERYNDFGPTPAFAGAGFWWPRSCPSYR
jgi:hypothetical protein